MEQSDNIKYSSFGWIDYDKLVKTLKTKCDQKPNESYQNYIQRMTNVKGSQKKLSEFKQEIKKQNIKIKSIQKNKHKEPKWI